MCVCTSIMPGITVIRPRSITVSPGCAATDAGGSDRLNLVAHHHDASARRRACPSSHRAHGPPGPACAWPRRGCALSVAMQTAVPTQMSRHNRQLCFSSMQVSPCSRFSDPLCEGRSQTECSKRRVTLRTRSNAATPRPGVIRSHIIASEPSELSLCSTRSEDAE